MTVQDNNIRIRFRKCHFDCKGIKELSYTVLNNFGTKGVRDLDYRLTSRKNEQTNKVDGARCLRGMENVS